MHRRIQELKLGGKVERRRREPSRGAEGAKGRAVWGRSVKMAYFRGLCAKFRFFSMTIAV